MSNTVKRNLTFLKEEKERRKVGVMLAESRIKAIANDENFFENLWSLEESKRVSLSLMMLDEIAHVSETQYISEQDFFSTLKSAFGLGLDTAVEQLVESILMSVFQALGIEKWWLARMTVSILATNPSELAKAFKGDCKTLTTLIAESMVEAMVMGYQQEKQGKMAGVFADYLRNLIGNALKKTDTVKGIEDMISSQVCSLFSKAKSALPT